MKSASTRLSVVGEWDPGVPSGFPHLAEDGAGHALLLHPEIPTTVRIEHPVFARLMAMPDGEEPPHLGSLWYLDPLARFDASYLGFWAAGFARVPGSGLVVIYQTRNRVMDVLAGGTLLAVAGGVWMGLRRLAARRGGVGVEPGVTAAKGSGSRSR